MLRLLDWVVRIIAILGALGLLGLGILLVLGKLSLRLSRRTRSQLRQWFGRASPPPFQPDGSRDRLASQLPTQLQAGPPSGPPAPTGFPAPTALNSPFATDGIAPPELPIAPHSTPTTDAQTNARLLIQLLKQLEGDVERRDRLIQYVKYRHPGQSDTWYLEKVVQDLDRDRSRKPGRGTPT